MEVVDTFVEILSPILGICDADMVPTGRESSLRVAAILRREALPHLPCSEHRQELRLTHIRQRRVREVAQDFRLQRLGQSVRIIPYELSRPLVMYLSECGERAKRRLQEVEHLSGISP